MMVARRRAEGVKGKRDDKGAAPAAKRGGARGAPGPVHSQRRTLAELSHVTMERDHARAAHEATGEKLRLALDQITRLREERDAERDRRIGEGAALQARAKAAEEERDRARRAGDDALHREMRVAADLARANGYLDRVREDDLLAAPIVVDARTVRAGPLFESLSEGDFYDRGSVVNRRTVL